MSEGSMTNQDKLIIMMSKIPPGMWSEMRREKSERDKTEDFEKMKELLIERVKESATERVIEGLRKKIASDLNLHQEIDIEENTVQQQIFKIEKKEQERKDVDFRAKVQCRYCGKTGHYRSNCFERKEDLKLKKARDMARQEKKKKWVPIEDFEEKKKEKNSADEGSKKRKLEELKLLAASLGYRLEAN